MMPSRHVNPDPEPPADSEPEPAPEAPVEATEEFEAPTSNDVGQQTDGSSQAGK